MLELFSVGREAVQQARAAGRRELLQNSWNAVHPSQGCGLEQLAPTGGAGLLYCFATN